MDERIVVEVSLKTGPSSVPHRVSTVLVLIYVLEHLNFAGKGQESILSLRPESVVINPAVGSVPNIFDVEVLGLIYLDDHIRTRVALLGRDDFVIKGPNSSDHASLREGDFVTIGWLQQMQGVRCAVAHGVRASAR